jgi:hypothetical protein
MARGTPTVTTSRIPDDLVKSARAAQPELADANLSALLRIALVMLAGVPIADAIRRGMQTGRLPGRPPKNPTAEPGNRT